MRFSGMYGSKFADLWRGCDLSAVKAIWAEDLAGYSGNEIRFGIGVCKGRVFPPTLPEFCAMCRPIPDPKAQWVEACEQLRIRLRGKGEDRWSDPKVYWAAVKIGMFDLNQYSWDGIKPRWVAALESALTCSVPEYRVPLPPPGQVCVSDADAREYRDAIDALIKKQVGTTQAGTEWAVRLMAREANRDALCDLSRNSWRNVLGYDKAVSAADAMAHRARSVAAV